ncbi:MAG TPA: hypothetical protein VHF22_13505, partial [Planctomycetota bacterium]|nr:hypothetical protein [Planctomycetota bacterium]
SGTDAVTTTAIVKPAALGGRKIRVRFREWASIGAGESIAVQVVSGSGALLGTVRTVSGAYATAGFVDVGPLDITTTVGSSATFRLRFAITTAGAGTRGWLLDDLDVVAE